MKRLIKKAELYDTVTIDGINFEGEYYNVYKNPSSNEIKEIYNKDNVTRGVILDNGDMYIWDGIIFHDIMWANSIINVDQFRFAYNKSWWNFNPHDKYTAEQMKEMIVKYEDKLSNIGNLNCHIDIKYEVFNNIKELKESMK